MQEGLALRAWHLQSIIAIQALRQERQRGCSILRAADRAAEDMELVDQKICRCLCPCTITFSYAIWHERPVHCSGHDKIVNSRYADVLTSWEGDMAILQQAGGFLPGAGEVKE